MLKDKERNGFSDSDLPGLLPKWPSMCKDNPSSHGWRLDTCQHTSTSPHAFSDLVFEVLLTGRPRNTPCLFGNATELSLEEYPKANLQNKPHFVFSIHLHLHVKALELLTCGLWWSEAEKHDYRKPYNSPEPQGLMIQKVSKIPSRFLKFSICHCPPSKWTWRPHRSMFEEKPRAHRLISFHRLDFSVNKIWNHCYLYAVNNANRGTLFQAPVINGCRRDLLPAPLSRWSDVHKPGGVSHSCWREEAPFSYMNLFINI